MCVWYGLGGQKGGMVNEGGDFPEVCKKSFQAQLTDIQPPIPEELFAQKSIKELKTIAPIELERLGRLNTPLYKEKDQDHYSPISWEQSIEKIVERFKQTAPDRTFFYSSGRSSNEAAFLLQLFARIYGTNNINNCSYYCHQASGVGIGSTLGTGTATIQLQDLENTDLIFVIGANPASNHPRYLRQLMNCRRRGGYVIVINPAKEKGLVKFAVPSDLKSMISGGSSIASEYIQIHIGSDIALLKGIAKAVIEAGKHDGHFISKYTNGAIEYVEDIQKTTWDSIVSHCGISQKEIERIANIYGASKNTVFSWSMGITHHQHGVENVESIVNLALLRGMIGKPNSGLLPLRGHSNVQGIGSVGMTPALKEKVFENIEKYLEVTLPTTPGMDSMSCMKAAQAGTVDLAFLLGGNLFDATPDSRFAEEALASIPFKVFLNTTLNRSHLFGITQEVLILPVAARDEERQKTTQESMFNFVRMSDGGIVRLNNVRSEVEIISEIAHSVLGNNPIDFEKFAEHQTLRKTIAQVIPGFEKLGQIDETKEEFQITGRTFHKPYFNTPDKKANFKICKLPDLEGKEGDYRMMTVRSEGQFNTIIYEEEDWYREQTSRWVVMMNKIDIQNQGLRENDLVTIESSVGKMEKVVVREFDIPSGNLITYFPESNILVPNTTDPRSKTPGYKLVWVRIIPLQS